MVSLWWGWLGEWCWGGCWVLCSWWGGGVGGVFVVVAWVMGCDGEEWGGWVLVCWVDVYNPYKVPHTIPQGNFNFPRSTNRIKFFGQNLTKMK